jgi:hypothetical protein
LKVQGTAEESVAALRKELLEEEAKTELSLSNQATSKQQATQLESEDLGVPGSGRARIVKMNIDFLMMDILI